MRKKYWRMPVLLVVLAMILSACTARPGPAKTIVATTTPITITIWHRWEGNDLTAIMDIFIHYMNEHQNVTIVLETPQDIQNALNISIQSGVGPDIISWGNDSIGSFAKNGTITDLGSMGISQDFLADTYEPAAAEGVTWQGKIWALPESEDAIAILYNKAIVSRADFPSDPMDFNGLLARAKAFAEANPGKYLICNQGLGAADAYYEAPIYFGFGVPGYVDDAGKAYLNTPEAIKAGNWIKEFSVYSAKEASSDICAKGIADGTFASWWSDQQALTSFEKAGIDYGILPMGKPFVGVESLMVTQNAVSRGTAATAIDIIKYYTNQANETQLALANQTVPANRAALNAPQIQAQETIKGFGAAASFGLPLETTPYADAQWSPVGEATQAIWNGSQTPEQALNNAQSTIETNIASIK